AQVADNHLVERCAGSTNILRPPCGPRVGKRLAVLPQHFFGFRAVRFHEIQRGLVSSFAVLKRNPFAVRRPGSEVIASRPQKGDGDQFAPSSYCRAPPLPLPNSAPPRRQLAETLVQQSFNFSAS